MKKATFLTTAVLIILSAVFISCEDKPSNDSINKAIGTPAVSTPAKTETVAIENDADEEEQSDWPEPEEIPPGTVITVSDAREFIAALGSDRIIELKPGKYNLSEQSPKSNAERVRLKYNKKVAWVKEHDGYEIELTEIRNLTIRSADGGSIPELIVDPRYAYVLRFVNSSDIVIDGIKAGHSEGGYCSGGVFAFEESSRITIANTAMYGSGTEGLTLTNVSNMKVMNSRIYECTYAIMTVVGGKDITFEKCEFDNNREFSLIIVDNTKNLSFTYCKFKDNTGDKMFYVSGTNVSVSRSVFSGNRTKESISSNANVSFHSCEFENEFTVIEVRDNRDGAIYKTVKMPNGKTWMAKNLNYKMGNSLCYGYADSSCVEYGRLYNWEGAKTACPSGWHLPSSKEWEDMINSVGGAAGKKLKSKYSWNLIRDNSGNYNFDYNGTDDYSFSALPGGRYDFDGFNYVGNNGGWWTATENGTEDAYVLSMNYDNSGMDRGSAAKSNGFSVRCTKND
jgi:uncharacterized protein (TIGR02145 family)